MSDRICQRALMLRGAIAVAAVVGTAASVQAAPVFQYSFPASWDGTGTTVSDLSPAGNAGTVQNAPTLTNTTVPPGAAAGSSSITTNGGGILTNAKQLLNNAAVAAAGGFEYDVDFRWDGTNNAQNTLKVIDYAGTESLQVEVNSTTLAGVAHFVFTAQNPVSGQPDIVTGPAPIPILANTWYQARAIFNTLGNAVDGNGNISGLATLLLTDLDHGGVPAVQASPVTKTTYGDTLGDLLPGTGRPIGVGILAFGGLTNSLVRFEGSIYNPSVTLGVVPEPTSLALLATVATAGLATRRRRMR